MKAYQIKIGKRGEQVAQMFIIEAQDYRHAIVQASNKWASITENKMEDACVFDLQFIEETNDPMNMKNEEIALELTKLQLANPSTPVTDLYISYRNKLQGKELTIEEAVAIQKGIPLEDIPTGEILATKEMQDKLKEVNECLSKDGKGEITLPFRDGGAALLANEKVANKDNPNYGAKDEN